MCQSLPITCSFSIPFLSEQVVVRVRPPVLSGEAYQPDVLQQTGPKSVMLLDAPPQSAPESTHAEFDYVAGQHISQGDFFRGALYLSVFSGAERFAVHRRHGCTTKTDDAQILHPQV